MSPYQINDIVEVTVQAFRPYGALVSTSNDVKGLLHISEISDLFVTNIADFLTIGSVIKLKIIEIDPQTGFLKLSLKQLANTQKKTKKRRQHENLEPEDFDFTPLKEMLPIWIAKAKERQHD